MIININAKFEFLISIIQSLPNTGQAVPVFPTYPTEAQALPVFKLVHVD
jgi:hypothetical protein